MSSIVVRNVIVACWTARSPWKIYTIKKSSLFLLSRNKIWNMDYYSCSVRGWELLKVVWDDNFMRWQFEGTFSRLKIAWTKSTTSNCSVIWNLLFSKLWLCHHHDPFSFFFVIRKDDWKDATDALASLILNADDAMIYKLAIDMEIVTIKRHNAKGAHS